MTSIVLIPARHVLPDATFFACDDRPRVNRIQLVHEAYIAAKMPWISTSFFCAFLTLVYHTLSSKQALATLT